MDDAAIKDKIREHYQNQLNNLSCTDELSELLEDDVPDGGPSYDRANELLAGARITIEWHQ
jgi:hypothetical protein